MAKLYVQQCYGQSMAKLYLSMLCDTLDLLSLLPCLGIAKQCSTMLLLPCKVQLYHVSAILYHVSAILYHVSDILYHASVILYHVSAILYHVPDILDHVSVTISEYLDFLGGGGGGGGECPQTLDLSLAVACYTHAAVT